MPPGSDERQDSNFHNGHTTFSEKNNLRYLDLVRRYSSIISGQFFGHLHSDSFRIIYDGIGKCFFWSHLFFLSFVCVLFGVLCESVFGISVFAIVRVEYFRWLLRLLDGFLLSNEPECVYVVQQQLRLSLSSIPFAHRDIDVCVGYAHDQYAIGLLYFYVFFFCYVYLSNLFRGKSDTPNWMQGCGFCDNDGGPSAD